MNREVPRRHITGMDNRRGFRTTIDRNELREALAGVP